MRNSLKGYHDGDLGHDEMMAVVGPAVAKLFEDADAYFSTRLERRDEHARDYPDSLFVNEDYDPERIKRLIQKHWEQFEADPAGYVERHLSHVPAPNEWLAGEWRRPVKLHL